MISFPNLKSPITLEIKEKKRADQFGFPANAFSKKESLNSSVPY